MATDRTWGQIAQEFIACQTPEEAQEWLHREVRRMMFEFEMDAEKAETVLRSSLGYMMGYYSDKEAMRMQKLLDLVHPFGEWIGHRRATDAELEGLLQAGMAWGSGHRLNSRKEINMRNALKKAQKKHPSRHPR